MSVSLRSPIIILFKNKFLLKESGIILCLSPHRHVLPFLSSGPWKMKLYQCSSFLQQERDWCPSSTALERQQNFYAYKCHCRKIFQCQSSVMTVLYKVWMRNDSHFSIQFVVSKLAYLQVSLLLGNHQETCNPSAERLTLIKFHHQTFKPPLWKLGHLHVHSPFFLHKDSASVSLCKRKALSLPWPQGIFTTRPKVPWTKINSPNKPPTPALLLKWFLHCHHQSILAPHS